MIGDAREAGRGGAVRQGQGHSIRADAARSTRAYATAGGGRGAGAGSIERGAYREGVFRKKKVVGGMINARLEEEKEEVRESSRKRLHVYLSACVGICLRASCLRVREREKDSCTGWEGTSRFSPAAAESAALALTVYVFFLSRTGHNRRAPLTRPPFERHRPDRVEEESWRPSERGSERWREREKGRRAAVIERGRGGGPSDARAPLSLLGAAGCRSRNALGTPRGDRGPREPASMARLADRLGLAHPRGQRRAGEACAQTGRRRRAEGDQRGRGARAAGPSSARRRGATAGKEKPERPPRARRQRTRPTRRRRCFVAPWHAKVFLSSFAWPPPRFLLFRRGAGADSASGGAGDLVAVDRRRPRARPG